MARTRQYAAKYLGGYPSYPKPCSATVFIDTTGLVIRSWGRQRATIKWQDVQDLRVVRYLELFPPRVKNKSVLERAALGGLLLGPIGAVVGGLSGVGQKQVLTMDQSINQNEWVVLVGCTDHDIQARCGFIFRAAFFRLAQANRIHQCMQSFRLAAAKAHSDKPIQVGSQASVEERLDRLKSLLDSGHLAEAEYAERRRQVLESI